MVLGWLRQRAAPDLRHWRVIVYTRQGCHLCDNAWSCLHEWQQRCGFALEAIDVDTDPELRTNYGDTVPVVSINGKARFKGCVNPVLLKRLITAEARKPQPN